MSSVRVQIHGAKPQGHAASLSTVLDNLNYSLNLFVFHTNVAFEAFKVGDCQQSAVGKSEEMAERDLFTPENIDHTLGTLLPSLFKVLSENSIGCAPLVLSSCLLAFLWLLDEEGESAFCVIINICFP